MSRAGDVMRKRRGRLHPVAVLVLACLAMIVGSCGACAVLPQSWIVVRNVPARHFDQPTPLAGLLLMMGIAGVFLLFLIAFFAGAFTLINTVRSAPHPGASEPEDSPAPPND